MAAITQASRSFVAPPLHPLAQNPALAGKGMPRGVENPVALKLKNLDSETLGKLQRSFFETAAGSSGKLPLQTNFPAFTFKSPADALAANFGFLSNSYFSANLLESEHELKTAPPKPAESAPKSSEPTKPQKSDHQPRTARNFYGAQSKGPGLFSSPAADKAAEAVRQSQTQTQNFLANQLGQSFATGNMAEFLGPSACFEDVLATVMMSIADKSEKEMLDQIRTVERGETGLNGFIANRAKDLGGIAGGALGGYLGGTSGAAIGFDVGERLTSGYAGQYGGSSRQIQFEKLKMMMHKQSEMMSAISNILATIHATNKNAISNIRG